MKHDMLAPWAEAVPTAGLLTADDLMKRQDVDWQYELVEGRLVRMAPTGLEHFYITDALLDALKAFVKAHKSGIVTLPDTGFIFSGANAPDTVLSPDIAFLSTETMRQLPARGTAEGKKYLPVVPDLVAEVASPDRYHPEMAEKARLYLRFGVRLVWIVWPTQQQVDVWLPNTESPQTLGMVDHLDGLQALPGFSYPVANLFD